MANFRKDKTKAKKSNRNNLKPKRGICMGDVAAHIRSHNIVSLPFERTIQQTTERMATATPHKTMVLLHYRSVY